MAKEANKVRQPGDGGFTCPPGGSDFEGAAFGKSATALPPGGNTP